MALSKQEFLLELDRVMETPYRPGTKRSQVFDSVLDAIKFALDYKKENENEFINKNVIAKIIDFKSDGFFIWVLEVLSRMFECDASVMIKDNLRSKHAEYKVYGYQANIEIVERIARPLGYYLDKTIYNIKEQREIKEKDFRIEKREYFYTFTKELSQMLEKRNRYPEMPEAIKVHVKENTFNGEKRVNPTLPYKTHEKETKN